MPNQELIEKLQEPIIRKFEKQNVYSSFKDNTWDTNLVNIQLISKFNKGFLFFINSILLIFVVNMRGLFL